MENAGDKKLFWACFLSLIATAFGFSVRGSLLTVWGEEFGLDAVQQGQIAGIGIWPFAVSIILFSLIIDKIGYGKAMVFAFVAHMAYGVIVICAPMMLAAEGSSAAEVAAGQSRGYWLLYLGNLIFALGNGTVEAVINPVVTTIFSKEKTKWLNILHAGWPGGLVLTGILVIGMGSVDWQYKVALIFLPVIGYGVMMMGCKFPVNERVASGTSYFDMLRQFGFCGALVVTTLIVLEVSNSLSSIVTVPLAAKLILIALIAGGFGAYVKSLGRPMFIFLLLIMLPLATTELGTDQWITALMEPAMSNLGVNAGWVLVYTSFIMMILRFFAGPIVHKFSPLGLLCISSVIATAGLIFLSTATGVSILIAATLYGFGKTFFWPTMLGVVSEQFPKGGALTLNATGGVGMLGVGVLGMPFIGLLQEKAIETNVTADKDKTVAAAYEEAGKREAVAAADADKVTTGAAAYAAISVGKSGLYGKYNAIDSEKLEDEPKEVQEAIKAITATSTQGALLTMAIFPVIMLCCYLSLVFYFKSKGGYSAEVLTGHEADDDKFTGGVEGPAEM